MDKNDSTSNRAIPQPQNQERVRIASPGTRGFLTTGGPHGPRVQAVVDGYLLELNDSAVPPDMATTGFKQLKWLRQARESRLAREASKSGDLAPDLSHYTKSPARRSSR